MCARRTRNCLDKLVYAGANITLLKKMADKARVDIEGARTRMALVATQGAQLLLRCVRACACVCACTGTRTRTHSHAHALALAAHAQARMHKHMHAPALTPHARVHTRRFDEDEGKYVHVLVDKDNKELLSHAVRLLGGPAKGSSTLRGVGP